MANIVKDNGQIEEEIDLEYDSDLVDVDVVRGDDGDKASYIM